MAERFFSALEGEVVARCRSQAEARMAISSDIEGFSHPLRRHAALGCRSPIIDQQATASESSIEPLLG